MRSGIDSPIAGAALALGLVAFGGSCGDGSAPGEGGSTAPGEDQPAVVTPDRELLQLDGPRTSRTRDGAFEVTWYPEDGVIPVNEPFEVDVTVTQTDDDRTPVTGATVSMSCFMPDHGHGMLREPRSEELGDGSYRMKGFLLHMGGRWTVSITVLRDGLAATADDEITI